MSLSIRLALAVAPIVMLAAGLENQRRRAEPEQTQWRDVIASAFLHPFLTDADIEMYFDDTHARVMCQGGAVLIRYPGIERVRVNGRRVSGTKAGPDLLRIELPKGTHDVTVLAGEPELQADALTGDEKGTGVATPEAFQAQADQLKPGDELVVQDGVYTDWHVQAKAQGTKAEPIVIRPQTPGGVTFRRNTHIVLGGRFLLFRGFRFEHCGPGSAVQLIEASDCRVTQCHFFHCGNPTSTFGHILRVDMGSHRNRVDHCYFTGSKSMSLAQRIRVPGEVGTQNRFDHNIFRDIYRYWINGQENIQLGQNQRGASGDAEAFCTVEYNLFDHAWGDGEIISNKCSSNVIRYNVAAHCRSSAFTLRGGNNVRFDGNVMVNNGGGLRVMGKRHTIVNNLIVDQPRQGIVLETGHKDGESNVATEGTLIAHNTIVNCSDGAIAGRATSDTRPHAPTANTFQNNLLVGRTGKLLDTGFFVDSIVRRNLFWTDAEKGAPDDEMIGDAGEEAIIQDPRLDGLAHRIRPGSDSPAIDQALPLESVTRDRWGRRRPHRGGPDVGADEVGAPESPERSVVLPDLPRRALLEPDLYKREVVFAQDRERPLTGWRVAEGARGDGEAIVLTNSAAALETDVPGDFVMSWEQHPSTFDAAASLTFAADGTASGYVLSWGGTPDDGRPAGRINLRKVRDEQVLADAADVLHYYQDFRHQGWLGKTLNSRAEPDPKSWYRFTLLKHGGRLVLLLRDARRRNEPGLPVLIWEDRGVVGGPIPTGSRLRIEQRGTGMWRGVTICRHRADRDTARLARRRTASSLLPLERCTMASTRSIRPFAEHGCEKMIYDVRMGPQALYRDGVITIVYQANAAGREAHPHIVRYDVASKTWSERVQIGEAPRYDHHFAPILWFDDDDRIHVLFNCHVRDGGTHLVSESPGSIERWTQGPEIAKSITYPRVFRMAEGRLLIYYRSFGHMGYWTYQLSSDGGYSWTQPVSLVDFDQNPQEDKDTWAGTYHSVCPSADGRSLHIAFVYWDEKKRPNPRYNRRLGSNNRYHLYYLRLDIDSGELYSIEDEKMPHPVNRQQAERCKVWDTGYRLTNMPAILIDRDELPSFLLPVSDDSPWRCRFHFVRRSGGEWLRVPITDTNNTWAGCLLQHGEGGDLKAYVVVGRGDGEPLAYGGGDIEEWRSAEGGASWQRKRTIVPDPGLLYNNPRPVELPTGEMVDGFLVFYGWRGPASIHNDAAAGSTSRNRGKAYLWHDGEWL